MPVPESAKTKAESLEALSDEIRQRLAAIESHSGQYRLVYAPHHKLGGLRRYLRQFASAQVSIYPHHGSPKTMQLPSNEDAIRDDWEMVGIDLYHSMLEYTMMAQRARSTETEPEPEPDHATSTSTRTR